MTDHHGTDHHRLLARQLAKAAGSCGSIELDKLLALVSTTYDEHDLDRRRVDHANRIMGEELSAVNADLAALASTSGLQNLRFQAALDNMRQGLCLFNEQARVVVCNRRFLELYGIGAGVEPVGLTFSELLNHSGTLNSFTPEQRSSLHTSHGRLARDARSSLEQCWPNGKFISVVRDPVADGGFLDTVDDVTENKLALARAVYLARHDILTELPNRLQFREYLASSSEPASSGDRCAVAIIDLDRFKTVNDTLGHPTGDKLLIAVSDRLRRLTGAANLAARLGGDEFAVVLRDFESSAHLETWGRRVIAELSQPYQLSGEHVIIGASVGIDIVDRSNFDADDVIRNADLALYRAKADGRGCCRVFQPGLHTALSERRHLEMDLRAAIARGELEVHYQPQIDLSRDRISGFEALARWRHPIHGHVSPAIFIPLAEESGVIDELGAWVLRRASLDAQNWPGNITVSVNVSAVQFQSGGFYAVVQRALTESGLDPSRLDLEVTESLMLQDESAALEVLSRLKQTGIKVSLDDFGTGYSSLGFLRKFPFDRIKIDRSFVDNMTKDAGDLSIVRAVASICRSIGASTVAEGVETLAQARLITREGIRYVQGYLYGRPLPFDRTLELLEARPVVRAVSAG